MAAIGFARRSRRLTSLAQPTAQRGMVAALLTALPTSLAYTVAPPASKPSVDIQDGGKVFVGGRPLRLSPSSVSTWRQCPQLFKYRYVEKRKEPPNEAMTAGTLVHEALANLFERPPEARTLENLQGDFREAWRKLRQKAAYRQLFFPAAEGEPRAAEDVARERAWGLKAFGAFETYLRLEDPAALEPLGCEERVELALGGFEAPEVVGVIDRLDALDVPPPAGADAACGAAAAGGAAAGAGLVITDYKTGRSPSTGYSARVNERIRREAFFQLQVYALMLRAAGRAPRELRLLYLADGAELRAPVTDADLAAAEGTLRQTWTEVLAALRADAANEPGAFPPLTGPLCGWCQHEAICPARGGAGAAEGAAARPPPKAR